MANAKVVQSRTRREVEQLAAETRIAIGLDLERRVSMLPILEQLLYDAIPGYDFQIEEDREMMGHEGLTDCNRPIIKLRHSTYLGLERGEPRARFTAAHEFGHLLMHCRMPTYRPFTTERDPLRDPERQANIFAAAFLMPEAAFRRCRTVKEAMRRFGVSRDAATCRARYLKHRFQQDRPILSLAKNRGSSSRRTP